MLVSCAAAARTDAPLVCLATPAYVLHAIPVLPHLLHNPDLLVDAPRTCGSLSGAPFWHLLWTRGSRAVERRWVKR